MLLHRGGISGLETLNNLLKILQVVIVRARTELRSLWPKGQTLSSTSPADMQEASVLELKISSIILYLLKRNLAIGDRDYLQNV